LAKLAKMRPAGARTYMKERMLENSGEEEGKETDK
jgi:hypothetical protein